MARRDIYRRKAYAVRRMSSAVMRLSRATSQGEKEKARYWVKMWAPSVVFVNSSWATAAAAKETGATDANSVRALPTVGFRQLLPQHVQHPSWCAALELSVADDLGDKVADLGGVFCLLTQDADSRLGERRK